MDKLKKFYKNKKVLVTGATGFKGSWLCLWLKILGAKVYGVSLKESNALDFDDLLILPLELFKVNPKLLEDSDATKVAKVAKVN